MLSPRFVRLAFVVFVGSLAAGCSRDAVKVELSKVESHLNTIANAYTASRQPNGRGPANVEQLKKGIADLTAVIGGSPDEVLVSPNDGKPFVIVYDIAVSGNPIIAYEAEGKGGKRWVVDAGRKVPTQVTDDEFKKLDIKKK